MIARIVATVTGGSRVRRLRIGLSLCAGVGLSCFLAPSARSESGPLLAALFPQAKARVGGIVSIGFIPGDSRAQNGEALFPWGFTAHLTNHENPDVDLTFPCGEWVQPPAGAYRFWIEGDEKISPFSSLVIYARSAAARNGLVAMAPVAPAGLVRVSGPSLQGKNLSLRLLSAARPVESGFLRYELSRRVPLSEAQEGVLMPSGPVLAALWSAETQRYEAISRPFTLEAGATVEAPLQKPRTGADLVFQVGRERLLGRSSDLDLKVYLSGGNAIRPPDIVVSTTDRIHALWYDLSAGAYDLKVESNGVILVRKSVALKAGSIARIVADQEELGFLTGSAR